MRKIFIIISALALAACDHYEEDKAAATAQLKQDKKDVATNASISTSRMVDNFRDSMARTNNHIREWWITPLPKTYDHAMPPRYCYRVMQDILCYRSQMPGWEGKLVGYQGEGAAPPILPTTKMMPLRPENSDTLANNRAANVKPIFVNTPNDVKETKEPAAPAANPSEPVILDSAHENLPETPLTPQL